MRNRRGADAADANLRILIRARRFMIGGLLASLFGNSLALGVVPGAVVVGALALFWIPLIQSVEVIEDLLSPVVARLLLPFHPTRILIAVESWTVLVSVVACILAASGVNPWILLVSYILVVSPGPLVIDVAEEMYAGRIAVINPDAAVSFNVQIYVAIGLFSTLVARPLGTVISGIPLLIVFAACGGAALVAIALRVLSGRTFDVGQADVESDQATSPDARGRVALSRVLLRGAAGAPLISGLGGLAGAAATTYVALWLSADTANPQYWLALILVCVGVGATLGPLCARGLKESALDRTLLLALATRCVCLVALLLITVADLDVGWRLILGTPAVAGLAGGITLTAVIQASARQLTLRGAELSRAVGWSHGLFAAGSLLGGWIGWLTASRDISATVAAALVLSLVCVGFVCWASRRGGDAGDGPSEELSTSPG